MKYESKVIAGKGNGSGIGFPTLNLEIPKDFNVQEGIYACKIYIDETGYLGALHFGPIPVFNETKASLEIFVLDWDGAHTPSGVAFEIIKYLRPIQNFATPDELSEQIAKDVGMVRKTA